MQRELERQLETEREGKEEEREGEDGEREDLVLRFDGIPTKLIPWTGRASASTMVRPASRSTAAPRYEVHTASAIGYRFICGVSLLDSPYLPLVYSGRGLWGCKQYRPGGSGPGGARPAREGGEFVLAVQDKPGGTACGSRPDRARTSKSATRYERDHRSGATQASRLARGGWGVEGGWGGKPGRLAAGVASRWRRGSPPCTGRTAGISAGRAP